MASTATAKKATPEPTPEPTTVEATPAPTPAPAGPAAGSAELQFGHVRIADLPDKFSSDGSHIADKAKASDTFDLLYGQMSEWSRGTDIADGASRRFVDISFDLRELCLTVNGAVDWAGRTSAYTALYKDRINALYTGSGMTPDRQRRFKDAVRRWNSDNDYMRKRMAEYVATRDKATDELEVQPDGSLKVGEKVAKAMRLEAGKQLNKANEPYDGFDSTKFVKEGEVVGQSKARQRESNGTGTVPDTIPAKFAQMAADVVKRDKANKVPRFAPALTVDAIYRLVSAFAIQVLGDGDKKVRLTRFADKKATTATLRKLAALAVATADALDEPEHYDTTGGREKHILPLLWVEKK